MLWRACGPADKASADVALAANHDATYLELAVRRSLPLATLDAALLKAMANTGVAPFDPAP